RCTRTDEDGSRRNTLMPDWTKEYLLPGPNLQQGRSDTLVGHFASRCNFRKENVLWLGIAISIPNHRLIKSRLTILATSAGWRGQGPANPLRSSDVWRGFSKAALRRRAFCR